ncbi:unnamed protein product, partial [Musa banksii]
ERGGDGEERSVVRGSAAVNGGATPRSGGAGFPPAAPGTSRFPPGTRWFSWWFRLAVAPWWCSVSSFLSRRYCSPSDGVSKVVFGWQTNEEVPEIVTTGG